MGEKKIKKEVKKPKKTDTKSTAATDCSVARPVVVQPTLIKKERKVK